MGRSIPFWGLVDSLSFFCEGDTFEWQQIKKKITQAIKDKSRKDMTTKRTLQAFTKRLTVKSGAGWIDGGGDGAIGYSFSVDELPKRQPKIR